MDQMPTANAIQYADHFDRVPGRASDYVKAFSEITKRNVILLLRVSSRKQKGNLPGQQTRLRQAAVPAGKIVIAVKDYIGPGHGQEWLDFLKKVASLARKRDAAILAATANRLARPETCCSANQTDLATKGNWENIAAATRGVELATLLDPDASSKEQQCALQEWGKLFRSEKTDMKKRRAEKIIEANLILEANPGLSTNALANAIGVPRSTLRGWQLQKPL